MEIRLPKLEIKCPHCKSNIDFKNLMSCQPLKSGQPSEPQKIIIGYICYPCGHEFDLDLVFEGEPDICDCAICKKIKS